MRNAKDFRIVHSTIHALSLFLYNTALILFCREISVSIIYKPLLHFLSLLLSFYDVSHNSILGISMMLLMMMIIIIIICSLYGMVYGIGIIITT